LILGDFNVNGTTPDLQALPYSKIIAEQPLYLKPLQNFADEYESMIEILTNNGEDELIDLNMAVNKG